MTYKYQIAKNQYDNLLQALMLLGHFYLQVRKQYA
jgi:hypothetical protein